MNEYKSVTDIDDVIKYAEREAEGCHQTASAFHTDEGVYIHEETRFQYKAILWENIHEWLEELKELRKKQRPHGEWLSHYDYCKKHECIPSGLIAFWWCNQCEQAVEHPTNFCPNCGSDNRKRGEANAKQSRNEV